MRLTPNHGVQRIKGQQPVCRFLAGADSTAEVENVGLNLSRRFTKLNSSART